MMFNECPEEFDNFMSLLKVYAGGTRLFPQERYGIHPEDAHAMVKISAHYLDEFPQHIRIAEIQVYLVTAECAPDVAFTIHCFYGGEQGEFLGLTTAL